MYYVYDIFGDGYTTVSEEKLSEYETFIGEYSEKNRACKEAMEYESYIQDEIDKVTGNYDYDDYEDYE